MYDFLGENAGGRIFAYGVGYQQIGTPYNFAVRTWPLRPGGSDGEVLFRTLVAVIRHTNGYNLTLQAIVDDVPQELCTYSGGPPPPLQQEQIVRCRCWPMTRGNRIEADFNTLSLPGEIELIDIESSFVVIRASL